MPLDLVIRDARLAVGREILEADIGIAAGRIETLHTPVDVDAPVMDAGGMLVFPGFVESHLHLDKSRIADRCVVGDGSIGEAMAATRAAKPDFTIEDIYERGSASLERCILEGTTRIRSHVEVDPLVGLRGLEALTALADAYRWAIDLEICVFAQDGLFNNPGTEELLVEALRRGAKLLGGAPYADTEPRRQIDRIFELAQEFDVDVDLHLDLSESPEPRHAEYLCTVTDKAGWGGRVTIGHLTQWSIIPPELFASLSARLVSSGISVTVLPATDLFLMGRSASHARPRGVLELRDHLARGGGASLATNNVLNPFTPYGDCSLARIANLYANVTHLATSEELAMCFELVTTRAAEVIRATDYGISPGQPADLVALDAVTPAQAVAEIAPVRWAIKSGRQSVESPAPMLLRPPN